MAGVAVANGDLALVYDIEEGAWRVGGLRVVFLPGSVAGQGLTALAGALAVGVAVQVASHGLGRRARLAYLSLGASLAALSAIGLAWSRGVCLSATSLALTYENPSFQGLAFGIWMLVSLAVLQDALTNGSWCAVITGTLAATGNAIGVCLQAPPIQMAFFFGMYFLLAIWALVHARCSLGSFGRRHARWLVSLFVASAVSLALFALSRLDFSLSLRSWEGFAPSFVPADYCALRSTLSAFARKMWESATVFGVGTGGFPLEMRFVATPQDWMTVGPRQVAAINGWWHLLAERGIVGLLVIGGLVAGAFLLWLVRFVRTGHVSESSVSILLGPTIFSAFGILGLFDASFLRIDAMLAGVPAIIVSARAIPVGERCGC